MKTQKGIMIIMALILSLAMAGCEMPGQTAFDKEPAEARVPDEQEADQEVSVLENEKSDTTEDAVTIEDMETPLSEINYAVLKPEATGSKVFNGRNTVIDVSNTDQGYFMVKYSGENKKVKVRIKKNQGALYTYDLNLRGEYEVYPISEGDGTYKVQVFTNLGGKRYQQVLSKDITVKLENEFLPFLYPNQYVNFDGQSITVQKGYEIVGDETDTLKKVEMIYDYTVQNLTYDYYKAKNVKSGYLPDIDTIIGSKKGICFDYAAVMSAMLRSQGIPCKLVVGNTGSVYHAWIDVYTPETGWVDGMIFFDGKQWKLMDPTFASSSKQSKKILEYIGNAENYQAKYAY